MKSRVLWDMAFHLSHVLRSFGDYPSGVSKVLLLQRRAKDDDWTYVPLEAYLALAESQFSAEIKQAHSAALSANLACSGCKIDSE